MDKAERTNNLTTAKSCCYRLLKIRLRSEKELRDKLKLKGFPEDIVEQTIKYFEDIELLDDQKFAKCWIASRLTKPYGFNRIKYELKDKGISKEIIAEETKKVEDNFSEDDTVNALAKKQASKYKKIRKALIKQRVYRYLVRRGFSSYSISKAIREL